MNVAISLAKQAENGKVGGGKKWTKYLLCVSVRSYFGGFRERALVFGFGSAIKSFI